MLLPTDTLPPPGPPTITPTPVIENAIVVYLVRKGEATPVKKSQKDKEDKDNKKKVASECDDTLVYISSGLPRTGVIENDVASALARLFATPLYAAGLYNPTHNSTFVVTKVTYKANAGQVTVDLDGSYVRSGDKCDNRRVRDQIWTTVRQFTGVKTVTVYVNGNLLGDVLANDR
jgi:spore germination protein GerM